MKKIHRFITPFQQRGKSIAITDPELIHQWKDVLKLRVGETIVLTNETQIEAMCTITSLSKIQALLEVEELCQNEMNPLKNVTLYLAVLKKENFELALQKASEMGITKIVPLITERTVKTGLNMDRLVKISREAAELSGRSSFTKISDILSFEDALLSDSNQIKILFDITGEAFTSPDASDISIYIGPEGGFTDTEIALAKQKNCAIASLSALTLRGETAAIIASYLALM